MPTSRNPHDRMALWDAKDNGTLYMTTNELRERIATLEADNARLEAERDALRQELEAWEDVPDGKWGIYDGGDNGIVGLIDDDDSDFIYARLPQNWRIQRRLAVQEGMTDGE